jgi:hypothetical protein
MKFSFTRFVVKEGGVQASLSAICPAIFLFFAVHCGARTYNVFPAIF